MQHPSTMNEATILVDMCGLKLRGCTGGPIPGTPPRGGGSINPEGSLVRPSVLSACIFPKGDASQRRVDLEGRFSRSQGEVVVSEVLFPAAA